MTRLPRPAAPAAPRSLAGMPKLPPPAKPQPGITGTPPLPVGKAVTVTPQDRQRLLSLGIDPDGPLPADTAKRLAAAGAWSQADPSTIRDQQLRQSLARASEQARAETNPSQLPPPVPLDTPPIQVETVQLEDLPPDAQAHYQRILDEGLAMEAAQRQAEIDEFKKQQTDPALRESIEQLQQVSQQAVRQNIVIEDDRAADKYAGTNYEKTSDAGAAEQSKLCPNCGWNQQRPVTVEPTQADIETFEQALLGGKSFMKTYTLMRGQLQVTFRNLSVHEADEIYKQISADMKTGKIEGLMDYYNRLDRMRVTLSLARLERGGKKFALADGLSPITNPHATRHWQVTPPEGYAEPTILPLIEQLVFNELLPTESLTHIIMTASKHFNELLVRLETLTSDPNFSGQTAAQRSS